MEAAIALPAVQRRPGRFIRSLSDERLVNRVRSGDEAAFEAIYDRHHRGLLSFCRHMLGSQQEAEDAVQHTFIAAYRSLISGDRDIQLKAWLYAIARNRSLSILRGRREHVALDDVQPATEGLAAQVERRQDLKDMLADLHRLPEQQRAALVLSEIGAHSHDEIGVILDVPKNKVKALVFQARTSIADSRNARDTPCQVVQEQLATLHGGALRRNQIRRHVAVCPACDAFRAETQRQKAAMAIVLPVIPALTLKSGVLGATTASAAGFGAGGGGAAAIATAGGAGVAGTGGSAVFGGGVVASGLAAVATKSLLTKGLVAAAVATGAGGGGYLVVKGASASGVLGHSADAPSSARSAAFEASAGHGRPVHRTGVAGGIGLPAVTPAPLRRTGVASGIGLPAGARDSASVPALQRVAQGNESAAAGSDAGGSPDNPAPGATTPAGGEDKASRKNAKRLRKQQRKAEHEARKQARRQRGAAQQDARQERQGARRVARQERKAAAPQRGRNQKQAAPRARAPKPVRQRTPRAKTPKAKHAPTAPVPAAPAPPAPRADRGSNADGSAKHDDKHGARG
jgi:RNA polymerase sigma factor (sigma-70 family)